MKRGFGAGLVVIASLVLAGCAVPWTSEPTTTTVPETKPDADFYGMSVIKPVVEGTELLCVKDMSYESLNCNWELWNKVRENR